MTALPPRRAAAPPHAHFRLLGSTFGVATRSATALRFLSRLYGPPDGGGVDLPTMTFSLEACESGQGRRWRVDPGVGPLINDLPSLGAALNRLEYEICSRVVASRTDLIAIHGATVFAADGAAIIFGPSGAGKTTLSLALAALGYHDGGDDVALLDPRTGATRPVPRCFHLDARSRRLLRGAGLRMPANALRHGFVTPADLGTPADPSAPIRLVLLLGRGGGVLPHLEPLTQAEMAARMLGEIIGETRPAPAVLAALGGLVGGARCYRLARGRLRDTADLVSTVLGPAPPARGAVPEGLDP